VKSGPNALPACSCACPQPVATIPSADGQWTFNDVTCNWYCPDSSLWNPAPTNLQIIDSVNCKAINKVPKVSRMKGLGCSVAWCAATQITTTTPTFDFEDWNGSSYNPKNLLNGACQNNQG
jgi:hypothetical protein